MRKKAYNIENTDNIYKLYVFKIILLYCFLKVKEVELFLTFDGILFHMTEPRYDKECLKYSVLGKGIARDLLACNLVLYE